MSDPSLAEIAMSLVRRWLGDEAYVHPDGCFTSEPHHRDCWGDGHFECRRCGRFEAKR